MRKKVFGRKLSRDRGSREALFRALSKALIVNGAINTTKAKAKAVQPSVEKMVKQALSRGISKRRLVYGFLGNDRKVTDEFFNKVLASLSNKSSGYTRIINLPRRRGDAAEMARLEWSVKIEKSEKKSEKKKARTVPTTSRGLRQGTRLAKPGIVGQVRGAIMRGKEEKSVGESLNQLL